MNRARIITAAAVVALILTLPRSVSAVEDEPSPVPECAGNEATLVGTPENDAIDGTDGRDVIHALGGNDGVDGLGGDDVLCLGGGDDYGCGHGVANDAEPDPDSKIICTGESEEVYGGSGKDQVLGSSAGTLSGGSGTDYLCASQDVYDCSPEGGVQLLGGAGDDRLEGSSVRGGPGDDQVSTTYCFAGCFSLSDRVRGGSGNDEIRAGRGRDDVRGGRGRDLMAGNRGDDRLAGGRHRDRLFGADGDDDLSGGRNRDFCDGGGQPQDRLTGCERPKG